jgi:hypothetical protein
MFNSELFYAAVFFCLACYTRFVGISLAFGAAFFFLFRKEYAKAAGSFLLLVFVLPWLLPNFFMGSSVYTQELFNPAVASTNLLQRMGYNLAATVGKELPDLFFYPWIQYIDPWSPEFRLKLALGCLLSFLLLRGLIVKVKREGLALWDLYVIVYFVFFYLTWTHHGTRYLIPLLAFLLYYLFLGIRAMTGKRAIGFCVAGFLILNVLGMVKEDLRERVRPLEPVELRFVEAAQWLERSAAKGSVVISRKARYVSNYTGMQGLPLLMDRDTGKQLEYLDRTKADYVIIDRNKILRDDAREYLVPLVQAHGERFEKVYESPEPVTLVYRVLRKP